MKLNAFTLAEVLVTLGIIGVVAALTMPTLIANYRKQVAETRLEHFYSMINQGLKQAELDNGPAEDWDKVQENVDVEMVQMKRLIGLINIFQNMLKM